MKFQQMIEIFSYISKAVFCIDCLFCYVEVKERYILNYSVVFTTLLYLKKWKIIF